MGIYGLLGRVEGTADCAVRGAEPAGFLNRCAGAGLPVLRAEPAGEDTLLVTLRQRDVKRAEHLALRACCELTALRRRGGRAAGKKLLRRWLPIGLCLLLFAGLVWSRLFIWDISVSGNETVSSAKILSALAECGVGPGTFWPGYTCDTLRSELLLKLPELSWATVQIYGSRAQVVVRERVEQPALFDEHAPTDITARREGFVTRVQTLNGTALVKPGSAVAAGEVLIAGAADSAFSGQRQLHAVGTVEADTYYALQAVVPTEVRVREKSGRSRSLWALEVGTKRINFYRNSSICGDSCDKITTVWQCQVKGLFRLPLALVRETCTPYTLTERPRDENQARRVLEQQLHEQLLETLGANGTIQDERFSCARRGDALVVCLRARCSEDIAAERPRTIP